MISEWDVPLFLQQGGSNITRWFISHYDFRMGCDPLLQQGGTTTKNYSMMIRNNNMNQDHYLTCRLTPQV